VGDRERAVLWLMDMGMLEGEGSAACCDAQCRSLLFAVAVHMGLASRAGSELEDRPTRCLDRLWCYDLYEICCEVVVVA
jgi:hypothetical protein